ncbi:sMC domain protein [Clostridium sp. CAG:678]|nr:sMC domain protein [Clostridium sp. CAG:678]
MAVKISEFQLENVKRIKAVQCEPTQNGITVIGGKNNQGKTSVLDSIAWALGGDRFRPSQTQREGSVIPPYIKIKLSNGIIVERQGKNSSLKVIDPSGNKGGQQLLNEFIENFALNLPKFMEANAKEKADILLRIIGVGDKLFELEKEENEIYNSRHAIGQIAAQKQKYADEMAHYDGVPDDLLSASDLIQEQQAILLRNAENKKKRERLSELREQKQRLQQALEECEKELKIAELSAAELEDRSTAELEENIQKIDEINVKIRSNLDKERAEEEAHRYQEQYNELSVKLENIRSEKKKLLESADLPLPGLSVEDGEITLNGMKWDNMSGSDQLKAATAIIRRLNPKCGFVLVDKLEQMDLDTLCDFGHWLEREGLQVIATRVSTGDECSIVIEDGYSSVPAEPAAPKFTKGVF